MCVFESWSMSAAGARSRAAGSQSKVCDQIAGHAGVVSSHAASEPALYQGGLLCSSFLKSGWLKSSLSKVTCKCYDG